MTSKVCTECKENKPYEEFPFRSDKNKKHLLRSACKECHRKRAKRYWKENPLDKEIQREKNLKKSFGITLKDYNTMLEEQESCCAICGTHSSNFTRNMAVDHCHDTLKIRGLLCQDCNTGLGQFKDSTSRLLLAVKYLEKFNDDRQKV